MTRSGSALAGPARRQWQREWGLAELFASHCLQEGSDSLVDPASCAAQVAEGSCSC